MTSDTNFVTSIKNRLKVHLRKGKSKLASVVVVLEWSSFSGEGVVQMLAQCGKIECHSSRSKRDWKFVDRSI